MRLLVTGVAGFIGARVAELALDRGDTVVGLDNLNEAYDVRLKHWRLARLVDRPDFSFHQLDLTDRDALLRLVQSGDHFDAVIHLAARAGVRPSVINPWLYMSDNATGTLNLLDATVQLGISKFVLSSTSSLYGQHNILPYVEHANTDRPLSPYAASKKATEALAYTYHYLHGLDVTVFRYFTVYGPAGRPDMSPFRFVQWVTEQRPVTIFGNGQQSRDFTYVDDIARGTLAGLRPLGYEVVNLGSDRPVALATVLAQIEGFVGKPAVIERLPFHRADVRATWASIEKAKALLEWAPTTGLTEGLAALIAWYNENRTWASTIETGE